MTVSARSTACQWRPDRRPRCLCGWVQLTEVDGGGHRRIRSASPAAPCIGGIEQIKHGNDGWDELVVELDGFLDDAKHDIRIVGVRVGAIFGLERFSIPC